MTVSCTCCKITILGKANILTGWQAKWYSGKEKELLCDSCYEDFKLQAIQNNTAVMDRGKFNWLEETK